MVTWSGAKLLIRFRRKKSIGCDGTTMLTSETAADHRRRLGFEEAALVSFDFLRSYDLKPVEKNPTFVRYESRKVFVNIYHGRASYEVGIEVGLKAGTEKYGLDSVVFAAGKEVWETEGFGKGTMFQVSSREGVQRIVPGVAELLRKYGEPFLRGDLSFYKQLDKANGRASAEHTRQQLIRRIREQAEAAWSGKSFARVIELYQSIHSELTMIERKRLAFARKQIRDLAIRLAGDVIAGLPD
jgi:hypothetical protein